jgi:hypothetical protein
MSEVLFELPDRYVLDTGEVVGKHIHAVRRVVAGESLNGLLYWDSADLQQFARDHGQTPRLWSDDGTQSNPGPETYVWNIPEHYHRIVLSDYLGDLLTKHFEAHQPTAEQVQVYTDRLGEECRLIAERNMTDFVRCLIYIVDEFRKHNVVWGVGRGSAVESLALFLIGIHLIDPVLNHIPLEHFFRS